MCIEATPQPQSHSQSSNPGLILTSGLALSTTHQLTQLTPHPLTNNLVSQPRCNLQEVAALEKGAVFCAKFIARGLRCLLERHKLGGGSGTDTRPTVLDGLVSHRVLRKVRANHLSLRSHLLSLPLHHATARVHCHGPFSTPQRPRKSSCDNM
jgi:hypothetical protein